MGNGSQTGASRRYWKKWYSYVLIGLAVLSVLQVFYFPTVLTGAWHLTHGRSANFHQLKLPVPWGWWSFQREGQLFIQKTDRETNPPVVTVTPFIFPPTYLSEYDKVENAAISLQLKQGYQFIATYQLGTGDQKAYCLSFAAAGNTQFSRISCAIPAKHVFCDFDGDSGDAPVFDRIVQDATINHSTHIPSATGNLQS